MLTSQTATAINSFALKLLRLLQKSPTPQNCLVSPVSIFFALVMVYLGSANKTQLQMANTLDVEKVNFDTLTINIAKLLETLRAAALHSKVALATSAWTHAALVVETSYQAKLKQTFDTNVYPLDLDLNTAIKQINQWVNYHSEQKIPSILESLNAKDMFLLVNVFYFKGRWQERFDPSSTLMLPFYLEPGRTRSHPLMYRSGKFDYAKKPGVQIVSLPFQSNEFRMLIFLPDPENCLATLIEYLDFNCWQNWINELIHQPGEVWLPQFTLNFEANLNEVLSFLGMETAFTTAADFSGITKSSELHLSKILHKAVIEVTEEGAEAAAATAITMRSAARPFAMKIDRPFLCVIEHVESQTLLFTSIVNDPQNLTNSTALCT